MGKLVLDFGESVLRALYGRGASPSRWAAVSIQQGYRLGAITDVEFVQEKVRGILGSLFPRGKPPREAVVVLPSEIAVMSVLDVPPVKAHHHETAVLSMAARAAMKRGNLYRTAAYVERGAHSKALVVELDRDVLAAYKEVLGKSGIRSIRMEIHAFALARACGAATGVVLHVSEYDHAATILRVERGFPVEGYSQVFGADSASRAQLVEQVVQEAKAAQAHVRGTNAVVHVFAGPRMTTLAETLRGRDIVVHVNSAQPRLSRLNLPTEAFVSALGAYAL